MPAVNVPVVDILVVKLIVPEVMVPTMLRFESDVNVVLVVAVIFPARVAVAALAVVF